MSPSVIILTPGSFPIPSPYSSSVEHAVSSMAPYIAKHIPITILGRKLKGVPSHLTREGVNYINFSASSTNDYFRKALDFISTNPPSLVQIENRPHYVQSVKRKVPQAKVWLFLHSPTFVSSHSISRPRLIRALRLADRILVNSHALKRFVGKIAPKVKQKILVNHLGVDHEKFSPRHHPEVEELRNKELKDLGINGKKVILYVGRVIPKKGVHRLLEAAQIVKRSYPDFVILIVGGSGCSSNRETGYVRMLKKYKRKYPDHIRFISYIPNNRIHQWYRLADVLVVPSIYLEAFGLVNVEGMATGIPVIASKVGGIKEIIEHGKTGYLVPLSNHKKRIAQRLLELLSNEELAKEMGLAGRKRVEEYFTWEDAARRLLHYYQTEL